MTPPLIIGYGNMLRGDDGAGVHAAELARKEIVGIDVLTVHELQPELAETIADRDTVIFIDASAGTDILYCAQVGFGIPIDPIRSHMLTPTQLLLLCLRLYGRAPETVYLIGIPANDFAFGESLSARTASFLEPCVHLIDRLTRQVSSQ